MSYQIKIDHKSLKVARSIAKMQSKIQQAYVESGKTQQEIATILNVDRSVVNRRLKEKSNLTERSIAEIAYALGREIEFELTIPVVAPGSNSPLDVSEVGTRTTLVHSNGYVSPSSTRRSVDNGFSVVAKVSL